MEPVKVLYLEFFYVLEDSVRCIFFMVFEIVFREGHQFCKVGWLLSFVVATCHYIWLCL